MDSSSLSVLSQMTASDQPDYFSADDGDSPGASASTVVDPNGSQTIWLSLPAADENSAARPSSSVNVVNLVSDDDDDVEVMNPRVVASQSNRSRSKKRARPAVSREVDQEPEDPIPIADSPAVSKKKVKVVVRGKEVQPANEPATKPEQGQSGGDDGFEKLKENLKCLVCYDIFYKPVSLVPCSHVFCAGCFSEWNKPTCPCCRQSVLMVVDAPKVITNMIDDYLEKYPAEKKTAQEKARLDKRDKVKRGVPLGSNPVATVLPPRSSADVFARLPHILNRAAMPVSQAINQFVTVTGAPVAVARALLQDAARRGLSLEDAVELYFQSQS